MAHAVLDEVVWIQTFIKPNTPHYALVKAIVCNDSCAAVEEAIKRGANVNMGIGSQTALMLGIIFENKNIVPITKLLIKHGAKLDWQGGKKCDTALMLAVRHNNIAVVELLMRAGADVEKKNKDGQTALDIAYGSTINPMIVHYLLASQESEI